MAMMFHFETALWSRSWYGK